MKMNARIIILSATIALVLSDAWAGDINLLGNLSVNSNLTAQSITLGGVTQTNWNFAALQGYKYVVVAEGTNDAHRGNNLLAAYATATTLNSTSSNRVAVIVPPGNYNLGTTNLVMSTGYVDIIGLVPAQMTTKQVFTDSSGRTRAKTVANGQCPVRIYTAISSGTIVQNIDNVRVESVILSNSSSGVAYYPSVAGSNTVLRHVAMNSMRSGVAYAGKYVDCVSSNSSFAAGGVASGTFIDCVSGLFSFGGNAGSASGTFVGCAGGDESFGGQGGTANGTFTDCVGGDKSFGSGNGENDNSGTAGGTFVNCVGGNYCFGGNDGLAGGTFIDCVGGVNSFGATDSEADFAGTASGTFTSCVGGDYSFGSMCTASGMFRSCMGGMGSFGGWGVASGKFTDSTGGWESFGGDYLANGTFTRCTGGGGSFGTWGTASGMFIDCTDGDYGFGVWGTLATTAKLRHCKATATSFGSFQMASDDFNYNVGGSNTFLMLPNLPTGTNGLPSGSVYNSSGTLKIMP